MKKVKKSCINKYCRVKFKNGCVEIGKIIDSPNGLLCNTFGNCGSGEFKLDLDRIESIEPDDYMEALMENI